MKKRKKGEREEREQKKHAMQRNRQGGGECVKGGVYLGFGFTVNSLG